MKLGNLDITLKVGSADCTVYLGTTLVQSGDTPTQFDGKYKFTLTDDSVVSGECNASSAITSGETSAYKTTLKEAVVGDCVTSIGNSAFRDCSGLTSCTIGSGVTNIGNYAFRNCSGLTSIDIPSGVTSIKYGTFQVCCRLTSVTILDSVTSIGGSAFESCTGLTSCTIGSGVTSIGEYAFYGSSLTSIDIPSGVTSIEPYAFYNCDSLTSVTVNAITPPTLGNTNAFNNTNNCPIYVPAESVATYKAATGWSTYASRIQAIPTPSQNNVITYEASAKLPETERVSGSSSSGLHTNAFSGTSGQLTMTSHTFENGVGTIEFDGDVITVGDEAFYEASAMTEVTLPNSVTSIGNYTFYKCSGLTSIDIPSGVTSINQQAFAWCANLTSLDIPDSVTSIGSSMISDSGIQTITIGSGITYIGTCGLCSNNLTNGVTIKAVNPPTIPNCDWIFAVQSLIYVPAESVTAYQNDQCWSVYAQGILPIT